MPLDLDPIYHTETLVKILRDQGSTVTAMELCEKILEKNPDHQGVRKILEELKGEARASFDRFRSPPQGERVGSPRLQKLETLMHRVQEYRRGHG
jgi:hypothetical protein